MIKFNAFPGGRRFAVTFSYDDGSFHDKQLISLFNQYGLKGTFHLNSASLGTMDRIKPEEAAVLYNGHEIACHTATHPFPDELSPCDLIREIIQDRIALEKITGKIVRGMSYPSGRLNEAVVAAMASCGIAYSRTTVCHNGFALPQDFLKWDGTCHHKNAEDAVNRFIALMAKERAAWTGQSLLYIWGHSFEFDRENNWDFIEKICQKLGGLDGVWYATNIEIFDYVQAQRSLYASADGRRIHNPSAQSVWVSVDGTLVEVKPGSTLEA